MAEYNVFVSHVFVSHSMSRCNIRIERPSGQAQGSEGIATESCRIYCRRSGIAGPAWRRLVTGGEATGLLFSAPPDLSERSAFSREKSLHVKPRTIILC
jgi:hypothetical protein